MAAGTIRENKTILTAEDKTGGAFASFTSNIQRAQASALAMAGNLQLLAGGAVIGGLTAMAKSGLDFAESMNKASQKTGIAVEEMSQYAYAAKLADVSNESLIKGVKGLSDMMVKANDATTIQAATMRALGVDIKSGVAPAMEKIADQFAKLPDGATKTALAVDLFGKAGQDMIPMLNQGAEGLKKMKEEADQLGLTVSGQVAADAERFNDNLKAMATGAQKTANSLVTHLAASLAQVSDAMKEAQKDAGLLGAAWVGLGGIGAKVWEAMTGTGGTEIEKTQRKIAELTGELAKLKGRLEDSQNIMGPWGDKLRESLIAGAIKGTKELAELNKQLAELHRAQQAEANRKKQEEDAKKVEEARIAKIKERFEAEKKAAEETKRRNERLQKEGIKGWIDYAQQVFDEADKLNLDLAKINDDYWANEEKKRQEDIKGWVAYADAVFEEADQMNRDLAKINGEYWAKVDKEREHAQREQLRAWDEVADVGSRFFADLALNGRSAFDRLRDSLKSFAADLIALFAKKWILQIAAGVTGSTALSALASTTGNGSAAGGLLNILGSAGGIGSSLGALIGGGSGVAAPGMGLAAGVESFLLNSTGSVGLASAGGSIASMISAAGPYAAALAAAYALYKAFKPGGGPKEGGSFFGQFAGSGALTSGQGGQWYGVHTADNAVQSMVSSTGMTIAQLIARFGGSSSGYGIQFGYDTDPRGTAPNRLKAILSGANGEQLYGANYDFARGDPSQQLQLEMSRLMVAALKNSNIEKELKDLFDSFDLNNSTLDGINALMAQAEELNTVLHNLAGNSLGYTIDSLKALQQAGESLSQTFDRVVGALIAAQNNLNQAIAARNPQFARDLVLGQRNAVAKQFLDSLGLSFVESNLAQMALAPQSFGGLNADQMNWLATFLGLQTQLEQLDQQLAQNVPNISVNLGNFSDSVASAVEALNSARQGLADYLHGSLTGELSPLNPMAQLEAARQNYQRNLGLAQGGDLNAIGAFGGIRDEYLRIARSIYASSGAYNDIFFRTFNEGAGVSNGLVQPLTGATYQQGVQQLAAAVADVSASNKTTTQAVVALATVIAEGIETRDPGVTALLEEIKVNLTRNTTGGVLA